MDRILQAYVPTSERAWDLLQQPMPIKKAVELGLVELDREGPWHITHDEHADLYVKLEDTQEFKVSLRLSLDPEIPEMRN